MPNPNSDNRPVNDWGDLSGVSPQMVGRLRSAQVLIRCLDARVAAHQRDATAPRPFDHLGDDPEPDLDTVCSTGPEMLAAALDYAARGWYVMPLHVPTRFGPQGDGVDRAGCTCRGFRSPHGRPEVCDHQAKHAVAWFQRSGIDLDGIEALTGGTGGATNDPMLVERYWTLFPGAGIGVDARRSGLVVLDIDSPEAAVVLRRLTTEHGPLDSWTSLTARGWHEWMTLPEGTRPIPAGLLRPLEVKVGQVTAPPSWHPSGVRYRWVRREGEQPAPSWLLRPAGQRDESRSDSPAASYRGTGLGTGPARRRLDQLVAKVTDADDGRHDLLVRAWWLAGALSANGWLHAERVQAEILEPLTRSCGRKHAANLPGFRTAFASGLADPAAARDDDEWPTWNGQAIPRPTDPGPEDRGAHRRPRAPDRGPFRSKPDSFHRSPDPFTKRKP